MGAVIVESSVLAAADRDDARAAVERLAAIGAVVLLSTAGDSEPMPAILDSVSNVQAVHWPGVASAGSHQPGRRPDESSAIGALERIKSRFGATWLIASEASVPIARSIPGLRVVCVGPAPDGPEPIRPDHRTHSLLEAARLIETYETFA